MKRRDFIALIGAAMACPAAAFAQDSTRVYRIFWLSTQAQPDPFLDGFREGLRARGYIEGKNVALELHYAIGNPQALREVATELRRGKVDLAVSSGPATRAMTAVAEVPVLFALSGDPVELGLVQSLGQPGGNFTGSTFLSLELAGKRVELLKEVLPNLRKLAVLSNANHPGEQSEWHATKEAAEKLGIAPLYVPFAGANELDGALTLVGDAHALVLVHNLLAFLGDAHDGVASLALGFLVDLRKHLLQTIDLAFGLSEVFLESSFEFGMLRGLRHFWQACENLLLSEIDILESIVKQVFELLHLRHCTLRG